MKLMFIDESGDHNLTKIDNSYPIFLLAGIVIDSDYYENILLEKFINLKREFFNNDKIILHSSDLSRNRNGFENLKNSETRSLFYKEVNKIMNQGEYKIIACSIQKEKFGKLDFLRQLDPYDLCLKKIIEKFYGLLLDDKIGGIIYAEKRSKILDKQIKLSWKMIKNNGIGEVTGKDLSNKIKDFHMVGKKENNIGIQMADLVASPLARHVIGKNNKKAFSLIEDKIISFEILP